MIVASSHPHPSGPAGAGLWRRSYPAFVRLNPTLRGFLIIAAIAALILVLRLEATLAVLFLVARIAFLIAIAFFIYFLWRERRSELSMWPVRAKWVFYGGAAVIIADLAAIFFLNETGPDAVAFVITLGLCTFAMWRTWKDQHTYS